MTGWRNLTAMTPPSPAPPSPQRRRMAWPWLNLPPSHRATSASAAMMRRAWQSQRSPATRSLCCPSLSVPLVCATRIVSGCCSRGLFPHLFFFLNCLLNPSPLFSFGGFNKIVQFVFLNICVSFCIFHFFIFNIFFQFFNLCSPPPLSLAGAAVSPGVADLGADRPTAGAPAGGALLPPAATHQPRQARST